MATFQLNFTIPNQRQGDREAYRSFATTIHQMRKLTGKDVEGARVQNVEVAGGSVQGLINIEAPSYQAALGLVCRNAPILDLEWHLEERLDPAELERILQDAMKK